MMPHRHELGWLPIDSRSTYFSAVKMYKILRMREPSYLVVFCNRYEISSLRGVRKDLVIPGVP